MNTLEKKCMHQEYIEKLKELIASYNDAGSERLSLYKFAKEVHVPALRGNVSYSDVKSLFTDRYIYTSSLLSTYWIEEYWLYCDENGFQVEEKFEERYPQTLYYALVGEYLEGVVMIVEPIKTW